MPALKVGEKAYYDTFSGLILCQVLGLSGIADRPLSSIKVDFELLQSRGAYCKGEKLQSSSLWVVPVAAVRKAAFGCMIGHYTVGEQGAANEAS